MPYNKGLILTTPYVYFKHNSYKEMFHTCPEDITYKVLCGTLCNIFTIDLHLHESFCLSSGCLMVCF